MPSLALSALSKPIHALIIHPSPCLFLDHIYSHVLGSGNIMKRIIRLLLTVFFFFFFLRWQIIEPGWHLIPAVISKAPGLFLSLPACILLNL